MTLILLYLLVLVVVAAVLFGRGEELPPLPRGTTATVLPASGVTAADVEAVKFTQTLRGYKTTEVDWVLERLGREIEQLRGQVSAQHATHDTSDGEPEPATTEEVASDAHARD